MTDLKDRFEKTRARRPGEPFVGFRGVGARLELVSPHSGIVVLRQTTISQLILIILMCGMGAYLAYLLAFKRTELHGGWFAVILVGLAAAALLGWGGKYLLRFVANRRVEFDAIRRSVDLYPGMGTKRSISAAEAKGLALRKETFFSDAQKRPQALIELLLTSGTGLSSGTDSVLLCCSDRESEVEKIFSYLTGSRGFLSAIDENLK